MHKEFGKVITEYFERKKEQRALEKQYIKLMEDIQHVDNVIDGMKAEKLRVSPELRALKSMRKQRFDKVKSELQSLEDKLMALSVGIDNIENLRAVVYKLSLIKGTTLLELGKQMGVEERSLGVLVVEGVLSKEDYTKLCKYFEISEEYYKNYCPELDK